MSSQPRNIPNNTARNSGQNPGAKSPNFNSFPHNSPFNPGTNPSTTIYYNKKNAPKQLNPNNRLINERVIYKLFKKFGIQEEIGNLEYYQLAFVHKSYVKSESRENSEDENDNETGNNDVNESDLNDDNELSDATNEEDKDTDLNESNGSNGLDEIDGDSNTSDTSDIVPFQEKPYERLEYIGDAILNAVIANYVFNRYPNQPEGFLTTLRTKLVRSNTLAKLTGKLKLQKYILISKHVEERCRGRQNPRILEDIFEAIVGAMFLDFGPEDRGWNVCQKFIVNVFESFIDITAMIRKEDNYKRILLEFYQKKYHTEPKYQIISMRGPTNRRTYTMGALSPTGEIIGIGIARRKTDAEQIASKKALLYYGEDVDSDSEDESSSESDESSSESESEEYKACGFTEQEEVIGQLEV